jgi:DNA-binding GntR family transcriptional regulator
MAETVKRTIARRSRPLPLLDRPADLAARVAARLRVAIVGGDLAAGERLVPERIAEELGVSRPPMMAAMHRLAGEGLVTIGANGRPYVAGLTPKYVADLYRFRLLLDEAVVVAVLGRVPSEAEASLRRIIAEMATRAEEGALDAFAALDLAFHTAFLGLADNQFLLGAWEAMSDVAHALLTVTDRLYALLPQLAGLHQAILDGLCAGDEAMTRTALRQHYETGERKLAIAPPGAVSQSVAADAVPVPLVQRKKARGGRARESE